MNNLPTPLFVLYEKIENEVQPFRRVHRLIDAFEWVIKWHTCILLGEVLSNQKDISDELKLAMCKGLYTPSLGIWMYLLDKCLKESQLMISRCDWSGWEVVLELEKNHKLINFRNKYAHGATPSDQQCTDDFEEMYPKLKRILESRLFAEVSLVIGETDGAYILNNAERIATKAQISAGHIGIVRTNNPNELLFSLYPLCIWEKERLGFGAFFFFNAIRQKKLETLSYEHAKMFRDKSLLQKFIEKIPLDKWRRVQHEQLDVFQEHIEVLTSVFKGREVEVSRILNFCQGDESGAFFLWGGPGIGKSALMAQVVTALQNRIETADLNNKSVNVVPYFIRSSDNTRNPERMLRYLCQSLDRIYNLKLPLNGGSTFELQEYLQLRLQFISKIANPSRTILFIDGLDEGAKDERNGLLEFIPQACSWLSIVCSARETPVIKEWFLDWKPQISQGLFLGAISIQDIRSMLYDVTDKYSDFFTDEYICAIEKRSQGNPLYVKLLCEDIINGFRQVGDIDGLPRDLKAIYKSIVQRVTHNGKESDVYQTLLVLAEAKGLLSAQFVNDVLGLNGARTQFCIDSLQEILEVSEDWNDAKIMLFHESFREYLKTTYSDDCNKTAGDIARFCYRWKHVRSKDVVLEYVLAFAGEHLIDVGLSKELWDLVNDDEYQSLQLEKSSQYSNSYNLLEKSLKYFESDTKISTEHLAQLAIRCGKLGMDSVQKMSEAFLWFKADNRRLSETLERMAIYSEVDVLKGCILLIWYEMERSVNIPLKERSIDRLNQILKFMNEHGPTAVQQTNWVNVLDVDFVSQWLQRLYTIFPEVDLSFLFGRTKSLGMLIDKLGSIQCISPIFTISMNHCDKMVQSRHYFIGIVQCLFDNKREDQAFQLLEKGRESYLESKDIIGELLLNNLHARLLFQLGQLEQSQDRVCQVMTKVDCLSVPDRMQMCSPLVHTLKSLGRVEEAKIFLDNLLRLEGVVENFNYIHKISAEYITLEQYDSAFSLIQYVSELSKRFNIASDIVKALLKSGNLESVYNIIDANDGGIRVLLNFHLAKHLIGQSNLHKAKSILQKNKEYVVNSANDNKRILLWFVRLYFAIGDVEQAEASVVQMRTQLQQSYESTIEEVGNNIFYRRHLLRTLMENDRLDLSVQVVDEVEHPYDKEKLVRVIVESLVHEGRLDTAVSIINKYKTGRLHSCIAGYLKQHKIDVALELFEASIFQNVNEQRRIERQYDNIQISFLLTMAEYSFVKGDVERGNWLIDRIYCSEKDWSYCNIRPHKLGEVVNLLCRFNQLDKAKNLIEQVLHLSNMISVFESFVSWVWFRGLDGLLEQEHIDDYIDLKEIVERLEADRKALSYLKIAKWYLNSGDTKQAEMYAQLSLSCEMGSPVSGYYRRVILPELVWVLSKLYSIDDVISLIAVKDDVYKSQVYLSIAQFLFEGDDFFESEVYLCKAMEMVKDESDKREAERVLSSVGVIWVKLGKWERALSLTPKLAPEFQSLIYTATAQSLWDEDKTTSSQDFLDKAMGLFSLMKDDEIVRSFIPMISFLQEKHDFKSMLTGVQLIPVDETKVRVLLKIMEALRTSKDIFDEGFAQIFEYVETKQASALFVDRFLEGCIPLIDSRENLLKLFRLAPFSPVRAEHKVSRLLEILYSEGELEQMRTIVNAQPRFKWLQPLMHFEVDADSLEIEL